MEYPPTQPQHCMQPLAETSLFLEQVNACLTCLVCLVTEGL